MKHCKQCGTCCRQGGATLHREDLELLRAGAIGYQHLTTIRKGELALSPISDRLEPTATELVRLSGSKGSWSCCFLDQELNACTIYDQRPLECRLLKCWDTAELLKAVGRNTLCRLDLIDTANPLRELIEFHEHECGCPDMEKIRNADREAEGAEWLARLTALVRKDLAFRSRVMTEFNLPTTVEVFAFGRPLFIILNSVGIMTREEQGEVTLRWQDSGQQAHLPPLMGS